MPGGGGGHITIINVITGMVDMVYTADESYTTKIHQYVASVEFFYTNYTTTAAYVVKNFGFKSKRIMLFAPGANTNDVSWSFNNSTLHGEIPKGTILIFDGKKADKIYLKSSGGGEAIRVWAW